MTCAWWAGCFGTVAHSQTHRLEGCPHTFSHRHTHRDPHNSKRVLGAFMFWPLHFFCDFLFPTTVHRSLLGRALRATPPCSSLGPSKGFPNLVPRTTRRSQNLGATQHRPRRVQGISPPPGEPSQPALSPPAVEPDCPHGRVVMKFPQPGKAQSIAQSIRAFQRKKMCKTVEGTTWHNEP